MDKKKIDKINNKDKKKGKVNSTKIEEDYKLKLDEMTDILKLVQANFDNYRKNTERRIDEIKQRSAKEIIIDLLPILDSFELALKGVKPLDEVDKEFVKGVEMIYSQIISVLEKRGLKKIECEGKDYDPFLHEALLKVESDMPEKKIIEELQGGYTLNGLVIRHSKVKISKGDDISKGDNKSKDRLSDK